MSRKILGLDIRRNGLAAVMINGTLQGQVIENLQYVDLDESAWALRGAGVEDGPNEPWREIEEAPPEGDARGERLLRMLELLAQKMDLTDAACYVSFPSGDVSYRNLTVPFRNKKKIKQILPFELEPLIPGSVDELALDFMTLDPGFQEPGQEDQETRLVAAAVNRALLSSFEACLKRGGVNPETIVPGGSLMTGYLCRMIDECANYLVLDMDRDNSTLFLIRNSQIASVRSFRTGQDRGRQAGLNVIRTTLAYSEQYDEAYAPEVLFVTGPSLKKPGTLDILAKVTGLPVEPVRFLEASGIELDERVRDDWDGDLFSGALALCYGGLYGVRGLTLTQRFVAVGKYLAEYRQRLSRTGILAAMVFVAFLFHTALDSYGMNRRIKDYDRQMLSIYKEIFPSVGKVVDPYNELKAKLSSEQKKKDFSQSNAGNIRVIDLLNDISTRLDPALTVELDRFVLGAEDLKLSGSADTYATVDTVKTKLETIPYVKAVVITSTSGEQNDKAVRFKLTIEFKGAE